MGDEQKKPIRILHVVRAMNRGGIETWLMHLLRHVDRDRFRMDFLVNTRRQAPYDGEIESLGSRILKCLHPERPVRHARELQRILREHGPYDIIHGHQHHYNGWVLRAASAVGVPVRIAHSHSGTSTVDSEASFLRRRYLALMKHLISRYATHGLAVSRQAASSLFGPDWRSDPRWRILYCGIDLAPFRQHVDRKTVRAELNIPADAFVVGHVGRFHEAKNHAFLMHVAKETACRHPNMRLLLVGDGPRLPTIEEQVARMGLSGRVVFAGSRSDVPRLMRGAMDLLVLPSLFEGLPLVGLEAQAAGIPLLVSDTVTRELDVVGPMIRRLSLSDPPSMWSKAILEIRNATRWIRCRDALAAVEASPFNIVNGIDTLTAFYGQAIHGVPRRLAS